MFPRGVITPASPAAPSRDEARALLAPEEERLLESNVSAKRTGALTWTLRGLGAVAVVSGVVAVASIAGPGRDAASAVLSRLGSSSVTSPLQLRSFSTTEHGFFFPCRAKGIVQNFAILL